VVIVRGEGSPAAGRTRQPAETGGGAVAGEPGAAPRHPSHDGGVRSKPAGEKESSGFEPREPGGGEGDAEVLVLTAGTSDIPVAEEAALTAELFGTSVGRVFDVGVAGLHRLVGERGRMEAAKVIIVVAGMEGALPSVVAGMVGTPVIGVPTSVGYGASLGGLTALFGMLNTCSGGLTVVNIDNGFGAGLAASMLARRMRQAPQTRPGTSDEDPGPTPRVPD